MNTTTEAPARVRVHNTGLLEPSRRRVLRVDDKGIAVWSLEHSELLFSWSGRLLTRSTRMPEATLDPEDLDILRAHQAQASVRALEQSFAAEPPAEALPSPTAPASAAPAPEEQLPPPSAPVQAQTAPVKLAPAAVSNYDPTGIFESGQTIMHPRFGRGLVRDAFDAHITVVFTTGVRSLVHRGRACPPARAR